MKRAILTRGVTGAEGTFGALQLDELMLRTTELPWHDNAPQKSCIPTGTYRCELVDSPKFGLVYEVKNVPGRSAILIHPANFGGDTALGWTSELLGCIAPARRIGILPNNKAIPQRAGVDSRAAVGDLMHWANGQPFDLEIR